MLHGQTRYNIKSRFLEELPESCLKWLTPRTRFWLGFAKAYQDSWASGRGHGLDGGRWGSALSFPKVVRLRWPGGGQQSRRHGGGREVSGFDCTHPCGGPSQDRGWFARGPSVFHNKFWRRRGADPGRQRAWDARVQVNFGRHGTKWLMLSMGQAHAHRMMRAVLTAPGSNQTVANGVNRSIPSCWSGPAFSNTRARYTPRSWAEQQLLGNVREALPDAIITRVCSSRSDSFGGVFLGRGRQVVDQHLRRFRGSRFADTVRTARPRFERHAAPCSGSPTRQLSGLAWRTGLLGTSRPPAP